MQRKNKWTNISLLLVSTMLSLLAAELFIRSNPDYYSEGYRESDNDKIVYELAPNFLINSLNAKISSQGISDRYFSEKKPQGIYRITVVGDSTSFGLHVGPQNSFPKILENILNKRLSGEYEVINFSVPGYNIAQEYEVIKEKVLKFDPDLTILVFDNNDIHLCNYIKPDVSLLNFIYIKSYLVHFIIRRIDLTLIKYESTKYANIWRKWNLFKKNVLDMYYFNQRIYSHPGLEEAMYINGDPPSIEEKVPKKYWHMIGLKNYKIHLLKIQKLLRSRSIKFISSGFFENSPDQLLINEDAGVGVICDFDKFLNRDNLAFEEVEHKLGHLSAKGHKLCAEYLYEIISGGML